MHDTDLAPIASAMGPARTEALSTPVPRRQADASLVTGVPGAGRRRCAPGDRFPGKRAGGECASRQPHRASDRCESEAVTAVGRSDHPRAGPARGNTGTTSGRWTCALARDPPRLGRRARSRWKRVLPRCGHACPDPNHEPADPRGQGARAVLRGPDGDWRVATGGSRLSRTVR